MTSFNPAFTSSVEVKILEVSSCSTLPLRVVITTSVAVILVERSIETTSLSELIVNVVPASIVDPLMNTPSKPSRSIVESLWISPSTVKSPVSAPRPSATKFTAPRDVISARALTKIVSVVMSKPPNPMVKASLKVVVPKPAF